MKTSIDYLPQHKQAELKALMEIICDTVPAEMIILFGSYARGSWVEDKYDDDHYRYQSDYDVLVIVETPSDLKQAKFERDLTRKFLETDSIKTPASIIVHDIAFVNRRLAKAQYFFLDIKKQGILLYDSQKFTLNNPQELSPSERKRIAQQYFDYYLKKIAELRMVFDFCFEKKSYNLAAFNLHQVAESLYDTILLVFTNYKPSTHDLGTLKKLTSTIDKKFSEVFASKNYEDERLFQLLRKAYVDARYKPSYSITEEELTKIAKKVTILEKLTQALCQEKIAGFDVDSPQS